jgi:hypothetical protein
MWLPRTIFEMAWTITPTLFLGLTFGFANNVNTKAERANEEWERVGDGVQTQHMTYEHV